ncbi:hypothetical protein PV664_35415 [Streptomyces sp. ME01-18a]|uniref:hypothetical protein n=1 Tax=Streptomyces sp. ME01-18a TaxID=3028669 RepID=UPI0029B3CA7E|nr:hypothetical protein [Streptomyces sp. ME01-18a]MDX3434158.1 hypothetical protein [Streptomyces sp. ME01-18a]
MATASSSGAATSYDDAGQDQQQADTESTADRADYWQRLRGDVPERGELVSVDPRQLGATRAHRIRRHRRQTKSNESGQCVERHRVQDSSGGTGQQDKAKPDHMPSLPVDE